MRALSVEDPELGEHERLVLKRSANRTQSSQRAVGGRLFVTNRRLVFRPHHFDANLDGQEWETDLNRISQVGQVGIRLGDFFGGGLRPRLRIRLQDGREELFVVNKRRDLVRRISSAVDSARSSS